MTQSWDAISNLQKQNLTLLEDPSLPFTVKYQVYENPSIIAFVCSPNCALNHLQQEFREMISSDEITSFDFLCNKSNASSIALHKAAFALFASLENQLSLLKQQVQCLKIVEFPHFLIVTLSISILVFPK